MSEEEWTAVFLRPYICLRETKMQSFQYKIIHSIINCNKKLCDMKINKANLRDLIAATGLVVLLKIGFKLPIFQPV